MNINNKNTTSILLLFISLFSVSYFTQALDTQKISVPSIIAANIEIQKAYIRETLPGNEISSAYMTIVNHSDKAVKLVSISSNISPKIEIHAHVMENSMMKMEQLDAISVKANAQVVLQPYGLHLMIFGLKKGLKAGQMVTLTLHFADQHVMNVTVPVLGLSKQKHQ
jgi:hypothetical protein